MSSRLYAGKWDGIWDKPKYQRIRDKISEAFKGIEFVEESHQYFYKGKELIPTSNVCHLFRQHFDEQAQSKRCSEEYWDDESSKYYRMTQQEILESWHANSLRATTHGTKIHLFGENCAYFSMRQYDKLTPDFKERINTDAQGNEYVDSAEPKEEAVVKFWNDIPQSIVPILFEVQMFDLDLGISGTADLLFLHDPHIERDDNDDELARRLYLMDYKTNRDLYKAFDKMLPPFETHDDNDLGGYKIQAAIYSYFLKKIGFSFVSRALIWLRDNNESLTGEPDGGHYEKVKMEDVGNILFPYIEQKGLKRLFEERSH